MSLRRRFLLLSLTSLIAVVGTGVILIVTYDELRNGSRDLIAALKPTAAQRNEIEQLAQVADWFALLLIATTLLLVLWVALVTYGLRHDVLGPLQVLRSGLGEVAGGNFEAPITSSGPTEIKEVGTDAEQMRRRLVREIDAARAAQAGLEQDSPLVAAINAELATPTDASAAGFVVHGLRHAAEGVISGDWWDVVAMPGGRTGVIVADATGHGPAAGIAALRVKTAARMLLSEGTAPRTVMAQLDRVFQDEDGRFVTLFIAVLDAPTGHLTYANAGHEPALLLTSAGERRTLDATGPLLSRLSGEWQQQTVDLEAGSVLVLYTDGLVDSRDSSGDRLGSQGAWQLVESAVMQHGNDAGAIAHQIEVDVRTRADDWANDDLTLVVVTPTPR